jgi:serine/threonine protein kinase
VLVGGRRGDGLCVRTEGIAGVLVKRILQQSLEGLEYMHSVCKVIHTDIKPENILLTLNAHTVAQMGIQAEVCLCVNVKVKHLDIVRTFC